MTEISNDDEELSGYEPSFEWEFALWHKHNQLRNLVASGNIINQPSATNMEYILYDSNWQSSIPLIHSQQCIFKKNNQRNTIAQQLVTSQFSFSADFSIDPIGENIAWLKLNDTLKFTYDMLQDVIVEQWFNQHYNFDYFLQSCNNSKLANDFLNYCVNYIQLVWSNTRYMACGVSICPNLYFEDNNEYISNSAFIVCDYWPSFRNYTRYIENLFPPYNTDDNRYSNASGNSICSECPNDRRQCGNDDFMDEFESDVMENSMYIIKQDDVDSLCYGCPEPDYHFCQSRTGCQC